MIYFIEKFKISLENIFFSKSFLEIVLECNLKVFKGGQKWENYGRASFMINDLFFEACICTRVGPKTKILRYHSASCICFVDIPNEATYQISGHWVHSPSITTPPKFMK